MASPVTGSSESGWTVNFREKLVDALGACSDMDDPAFRVQFISIARERLGSARAFQISSSGDAQQFIRAVVRACGDHKAPDVAVSVLSQAMSALRPDSRAAMLLADCSQAYAGISPNDDQPAATAGPSISNEGLVSGYAIFDLDELRRLAETALEATGSEAPEAGSSYNGLIFNHVEIRTPVVTFTGSLRAGQQWVLVRVDGGLTSSQPFDRASFRDRVRRAHEISSHPNVARLLVADLTEHGYPFIIQATDRPVTRYNPAFISDKVIDIGYKLADVFFYAHNHGVTLGGIDSTDLMLTAEGEPILIFPRLPVLAVRDTSTSGLSQDVYDLSRALLSMLDRSQQANGSASWPIEQARRILRSGMHEKPELRPTTMLLRDQLGALRVNPIQHSDDPGITLAFAVHKNPPAADIILTTGDLFNEPTDLVIGFSDTFDTLPDGIVISPTSLQGQLVNRLYGHHVEELDLELNRSLAAVSAERAENPSEKTRGKLIRYPIGTIATLEQRGRRIFAVAVSHMGNDLVAQSSSAFIDKSLGLLWEEIRRYGHDRTVTMPIIGSGLSRVDSSHTFLVLEIMSSFASEVQREAICRQLRIVVYPPDWKYLNIAQIVDVAQRLPHA